jgi:hypothetical protein
MVGGKPGLCCSTTALVAERPLSDTTTANVMARPVGSVSVKVRWSPDFGQVFKLGSPFDEDEGDDGQAEAVFG